MSYLFIYFCSLHRQCLLTIINSFIRSLNAVFILDFYKFCIPHLLEQHDDNEDVSTSSSSFSRESAAAAIRGATEALQIMDLWQLAEHAVDRAVKEVLKSEMEAVIENESSEFVLEDLIEASKACLPVLEYINTLRSGSSKIEVRISSAVL